MRPFSSSKFSFNLSGLNPVKSPTSRLADVVHNTGSTTTAETFEMISLDGEQENRISIDNTWEQDRDVTMSSSTNAEQPSLPPPPPPELMFNGWQDNAEPPATQRWPIPTIPKLYIPDPNDDQSLPRPAKHPNLEELKSGKRRIVEVDHSAKLRHMLYVQGKEVNGALKDFQAMRIKFDEQSNLLDQQRQQLTEQRMTIDQQNLMYQQQNKKFEDMQTHFMEELQKIGNKSAEREAQQRDEEGARRRMEEDLQRRVEEQSQLRVELERIKAQKENEMVVLNRRLEELIRRDGSKHSDCSYVHGNGRRDTSPQRMQVDPQPPTSQRGGCSMRTDTPTSTPPVQPARPVHRWKARPAYSRRTILTVVDPEDIDQAPPPPPENDQQQHGPVDENESLLERMELIVNEGIRKAFADHGIGASVNARSALKSSTRGRKTVIVDPEITPAERSKYLRCVRGVFQSALHYEQDDDFWTHESADPTAVQKYAENAGDGPDRNNLHLDMHGRHNSMWNKQAFQLILEDFKQAMVKESLAPRTDEYLNEMIKERFKRLSDGWKRAQRKFNAQGEQESSDALEKRMIVEKDAQLKRARHATQRREKYSRRVRTLDCIIQMRMGDDDSSQLRVWKWLKRLLEILGTDGMSSDESAMEDIEVVYRVKILVWRRNMDDYMDIIDRTRVLDTDLYPARGAKPTKRVRDKTNQVSDRQPVCGLPRSVYDDDWIEHKGENYRELTLHVSKEQFNWMVITAKSV